MIQHPSSAPPFFPILFGAHLPLSPPCFLTPYLSTPPLVIVSSSFTSLFLEKVKKKTSWLPPFVFDLSFTLYHCAVGISKRFKVFFVSRRHRFSSAIVKLCGGFFVFAGLCCFGGSFLLCLLCFCGCVWWVDLFDSLMFSICWDLQASRHYGFLHSSPLVARKKFYAWCCVQGAVDTRILITCCRLIYSPILKPQCSLQMFTCYIFCNLI